MTAKTLSELAKLCGAVLEGAGDLAISGPASLTDATASEISFLANPKYRSQLESTEAGGVVVGDDVVLERKDLSLLRCADPNSAFTLIVGAFAAEEASSFSGVHSSAVIGAACELASDASIGANAVIGAGCHIGAGAVIHPGTVLGAECRVGAGTVIHPNVTLYNRMQIGERCLIHSGCVIGADGYGFEPTKEGWTKVPQCGNVIIEDDVELGSNVTIDRARFGATRIRRGAKVDNLVHIAHNVDVGENALLVAQVGLSGSTRVGNWAILGGQTGVAGHIDIGDGARVGGGSAVTTDIPPGVDYMGRPARPRMEALKRMAAPGRIAKLQARVEKLEEELRTAGGGQA